jgi:hypothetical protein
VANKLLQAEGQATVVILNGRGSGLSAAAVRAGLAEYAGRRHRGHLASVRVLGDAFDLAWTRVRTLDQQPRPAGRRDRAGSTAPSHDLALGP